ncbi:MAG: hypothetical protein ABGX27_00145 [Desulfurobacteriaceae bacterium]
MKKLLSLSLVGMATFLGCNVFESIADKESVESCQYEVSYALDKQDYTRAIELLNGECASAFNETERYINLGAAYLGLAGYDIPSLITNLLNSNDESNNSFATFISKSIEGGAGIKIVYAKKAREYYLKALGSNVNCDNPKTRLEKDACFFKSISDIAQATTSFASLFETVGTDEKTTEEAITAWAASDTTQSLDCDIDADQDGVVDAAEFSGCALKYSATEDNNTTICEAEGVDINVLEDNVTFGYETKTFEVIKLTISGNSTVGCSNNTDYKVLEKIDDGTKILVLTSGYCYADNGIACESVNETTGCYPCPIVEDGNDTLTVVESVVELLNNGTESIANLVGDNATDIEDALTEIKKDICEAGPEYCTCGEENCTTESLESADNITITVNATEAQKLLSEYLTQIQ